MIEEHLEALHQRYLTLINGHSQFEKRLMTILHDLEKCSTFTGDQFTRLTREYLQVEQNRRDRRRNHLIEHFRI